MTSRHDHPEDDAASIEAIRSRPPRNRLPNEHDDDDAEDFSHKDLIERLSSIDGLEIGHGAHVNFAFRSRPFLHFHEHDGRVHADVKFGSGDFEAIPASTSSQRRALLDRVEKHVTKIHRARKGRSTRRSSTR